MDTLSKIGETLDCLRQNEVALLSLETSMKFEKEGLQRAQDSLMAHLEFLKGEYQKTEKKFTRLKDFSEKKIVYNKLLDFNTIARRPLIGYLPLFREAPFSIRKRRISKIILSKKIF